jgi:diacylglycerol kinase (ATP)
MCASEDGRPASLPHSPTGDSPPADVVVNPAAANGRVAKHVAELGAALREVLPGHRLFLTEGPGHATALVRQALGEGTRHVVAVGGDGTLNEVVNGFFAGKQPVSPEAALSVIPYGTGTDFARTIGAHKGERAVRHIPRALPRKVDVGCVTHGLPGGGEAVRYFVNVADFGTGGAVVKRVNESSKFFGGFPTFLYAVVATLLTYRNPRVRMDIDGTQVDGYLNNVIVANGQYYGGGMHVAPEARLDSGEFEVYVIGDVGTAEAILNLPKLYRGHLLKKADKVQYYLAKRVVARSDEEVLLNLDGEQPGRLPAAFEMLPSALTLLV